MSATILLVQPDPAQSRRLHQLLFDQGYESRSVPNAEEALGVLESTAQIDLVVLELVLPGMDGFQLLEKFRRFRGPEQTSAVVVSASSEMIDKIMPMQKALGLEAVTASKSSAVILNDIFKKVLGPPPADLSQPSMRLPTRAFTQLARGKEDKRLAKVVALHLTQDLSHDEALQKLVRETAAAFDFPMAIISVTIQNKRFIKAHVGLKGRLAEASGKQFDWSFCSHATRDDRPSVLVVPDARKHPAFRDNPLVHDGYMVSYVGAPVVSTDGADLGTFCLIDQKPHLLRPEELDLFTALAKRVAEEIELSQRVNHLKQDLSRQQDKSLEREEQLGMLNAVLERLHLGVLLLDSERRIVLANDRVCEITGFERDYLLSSDSERFAMDLLSLFDKPDSFAHKMKVLDEWPYVANEIFEVQRPRRQILRWTARPIDVGKDWYQLSTYEDLTAEVDLEVQREHLATVDPLTELLNRRGIEEEGIREAERAKRKKRAYSLLRLELNGLVELNQHKGFEAGDLSLQAVGKALRRSLRVVDRSGRWGGRQFLIILPETNETEARPVAERIRKAVEKLDFGVPLTVTGALAYSDKDPDFANCLDLAERKLDLARANNPGKVF